MRRVNPVLDGLLRHGKKRFSEAPLFRANLITLLHYLHSLGFGDGVQACTGRWRRDHRVRRQLQTVFGRYSSRTFTCRLEVKNATVGAQQIDDPAPL